MNTQILSNIALGTHEDTITKCAKSAIIPYRLVVLDANNAEQVEHAVPDGLPFGVATDEASAGEIVSIDLLGCSNTIKIAAAGTIAAGDLLIPGSDGKVIPMPTTAGKYTCIGIALSGVSSGELVEALTSLPSQYTVTA